MHSRVEAAEKFKRWVTEEVLPSIRKTGSYGVPKSPAEIVGFAERTIALLTEAQTIIADQAKQLEEAAPKVAFVDEYVDASGLFTITAAAKLFKIKRDVLTDLLVITNGCTARNETGDSSRMRRISTRATSRSRRSRSTASRTLKRCSQQRVSRPPRESSSSSRSSRSRGCSDEPPPRPVLDAVVRL
jgi:hypothetical protein